MNAEVSSSAIQARREYYAEWRRKNRERIKIYNSRYWENMAIKKRIEKNNANKA